MGDEEVTLGVDVKTTGAGALADPAIESPSAALFGHVEGGGVNYPPPPTMEEIQTGVIGEFARAGRVGYLQTTKGAAEIDSLVASRLVEQQSAHQSMIAAMQGAPVVNYPAPFQAPQYVSPYVENFQPPALYNADAALVRSGSAGSVYSSYDPRYGPAPLPPEVEPPTDLVPISSQYRRGYSGAEQAGRGYAEDVEQTAYAQDPRRALVQGDRRPAFSEDGSTYNERQRRATQPPWHEAVSPGPPLDAEYPSSDFIDVEGRAYNAGLGGRVREAGDRMRAGVSEMMRMPGMDWAIGFGAMSTAQGVTSALKPAVGGEEYIPGQVAQQSATSLFPLIGAVAGTVAGFRMGGAQGALGGQFVGQSLGQTAEDLTDAYQTGHTFAQQRAGEALGSSRGGKEAVDEFVEALRTAATPAVKQLADTMTAVGRTGPVSPGAASEFGQLQFQLGSDFDATTTGVQKMLDSSPYFARQRQAFGTAPLTGVSPGEYRGLAAAGAATGNYDAMEQALAYAEAVETRGVENPGYRVKSDFIKREEGQNVFEQIGEAFVPSRVRAYNEAKDALGTTPQFLPGTVTPATRKRHEDMEAQYETFQEDQALVATATSHLGADSARLSLRVLQGGGAAAMRGAQAGLEADARGGINAAEADIAILAGYKKDSPQFAPFYDNMIGADRQKEAAFRAAPVENSVAAVAAGLAEEQARFTNRNLRDTIAGRTAAEQFSGDIEYFHHRGREARTLPGLSPAQRDQMESEALAGAYQTQQGLYAETLGNLDNAIGTAGVQAGRARLFGSAGDVDQAQTQELDAFKAKVAELNQELAHGVLTATDRIAKERELSQVYGQSDQLAAARRDSRLATGDAFASDQLQIDSAGLGRAVRLGGSGAIDTAALDRDFAGVLAADQARVNAYAPGSVGRRDAEAKMAKDRAHFAEVEDGFSLYTPTARERTAGLQAGGRLSREESAFHRSLEAPNPYGGPMADAMTRGLGLERAYGTEISRLGTEFGKETARRAQRVAAGKWDDLAQEAYVGDQERYLSRVDNLENRRAGLEHDRTFEMFGALPERIIGTQGMSAGVQSALIAPGAVSAWFGGGGPGVGNWGGGPAAVMARLGGAAGPPQGVQAAVHPYHPDTVATGTGHGYHYEGMLPGSGGGNIGRPGTPGYSGVLEPHHMAPGAHTGSGHQYEGLLPERAAIHPPAPMAAAGGGQGTAEIVRVLKDILREMTKPRTGGTPFDQTAGIKAHLDSTYNTYTRK